MSSTNHTPTKIVQAMYEQDDFSQWLGIECISIDQGTCTLKMVVRKEMTNGFDIAHGGITYSFADSAFAFASNSLGRKSVSIETSISHLKAVHIGDTLTAVAKQVSVEHKVGSWVIEVNNQHNELVAHFKGMVYRKREPWDV